MYLFLFIFWIILNGKFNIEILLFGLAITAAVGLLCAVLFDYTPKKELRLLKKVPLFVCYVFVLLWEIIKAAFGVIILILNSRRTIQTTLVTFDADLKTDMGRFILANSITLTPGTITVNQEGNRFTVHCLNRTMLDTSEDSVFMRWIRRLEA